MKNHVLIETTKGNIIDLSIEKKFFYKKVKAKQYLNNLKKMDIGLSNIMRKIRGFGLSPLIFA